MSTTKANKEKLCAATSENSSVKQYSVSKYTEHSHAEEIDLVSAEEPLEIRIANKQLGENFQIAITMRTPGNDTELALGFLFTEGIIANPSDVLSVDGGKCNIVKVELNDELVIDSAKLERHSFMASSCGVCGKRSIDAVMVKRQFDLGSDSQKVSPELIASLPEKLRRQQEDFERTGGIHASCLFDIGGNLIGIKEDVGRHNALDKVIGEKFLSRDLPLSETLLLVSGRASFELVQKAAQAGIPLLAAVGAPSSLAIELAKECKMTLIGFVRDNRFNVYSGNERLAARSLP